MFFGCVEVSMEKYILKENKKNCCLPRAMCGIPTLLRPEEGSLKYFYSEQGLQEMPE